MLNKFKLHRLPEAAICRVKFKLISGLISVLISWLLYPTFKLFVFGRKWTILFGQLHETKFLKILMKNHESLSLTSKYWATYFKIQTFFKMLESSISPLSQFFVEKKCLITKIQYGDIINIYFLKVTLQTPLLFDIKKKIIA